MSRSRSAIVPSILALALLAVAALACAYASMKHTAIVEKAERENLAFTRMIAAEFVTDIEAFVHAFKNSSPEAVRRAPETAAFRGRLGRSIRERGVLKVKVYAPSGVAVFSTDASQIGGGVSDGVDFNAIARHDDHFSRLTFRQKIAGLDRMELNRYVVSSYAPVFAAGGRKLAVLEIYADVTAGAQHAVRMKWASAMIMMLALLTVGLTVWPLLQRPERVPAGPVAAASTGA